MDQVVKNTFLEGIKGDNHSMDISPRAALDLINADILSESGDQLILQARKSNVPIDNPEYKVEEDTDSFTTSNGSYVYEFEEHVTSFRIKCTSDEIAARSIYIVPVTDDGVTQPTIFISNSNFHTFEYPGKKVKAFTFYQDDEAEVVDWNTSMLLETMIENSKIVGLSSENTVLGVKEHGGVAYIISGKETDIHAKYSEQNNTGTPQPIDDQDRGSEVDERDSADSTKYDSSTGNQLLFDKQIVDTNLGEFGPFWTNKTANHEVITTTELFEAGDITETGKYVFNIDFESQVRGGNARYHTLKLEFYNGATLVGSQEVGNTTNPEAVYNLFLNTTISLDLTSGQNLSVKSTQNFRFDNKQDVRLFARVLTIETPTNIIAEDETITGAAYCSTSATTSLHKNGIIVASSATPGAEIAIDNKPFELAANKTYEDLAPGSYTVYFKLGTTYTSKKVVVPVEYVLPDLVLKAYVTDFISISDFNIKIEPEDQSTLQHVYTVGYEDITDSNNSDSVSAQTGNSYTFHVTELEDETILKVYVEASVAAQTGITASTYKRRSQANVSITADLLLNNLSLEIGTFPSPDYTRAIGSLVKNYKPLNNYNGGEFITNEVLLGGLSYLDVEIQQSYDRSVNIIFAEKGKPPRLVNSGFAVVDSENFEIIQRNTDSSTNVYTSSNIDVATRLASSVTGFPKINLKAVNNSGGNLEVGTYKYFVSLATADGNESDIVGETGVIPIVFGDTYAGLKAGEPNDRTPKSILLDISGVPSAYSYAKLYYVINTGEEVNVSSTYSVSKEYTVDEKSGKVTIVHTGFEPVTQVSEDVISTRSAYIDSVATVAQVQNRLFTANISETVIDYNKLFSALNKVFCVPSHGNNAFKLLGFYNSIHSMASVETDIVALSAQLFDIDINSGLYIPDYNEGSDLYTGEVRGMLNKEAFHNPLTVEKFSPSWPHETYKYGMCIELENGVITDPIPIVGGDFSDSSMFDDTNTVGDALLTSMRGLEFASKPEWVTNQTVGSQDYNFNNLGVVRFPGFRYTNQAFYPRFQFDFAELVKEYPELFAKAKGFFFVRNKRKEDVAATGFITNTSAILTHASVLEGFKKADFGASGVYQKNSTLLEYNSYVPMFDDDMILGKEIFTGEDYSSAELIEQSGFNIALEEISNLYDLYPKAFYSYDVLADLPKAAANFQGAPFSLQTSFNSSHMSERSGSTVFAQRMKTFVNISLIHNGTYKIAPIFVDYGKEKRNAGGFASKAEYRAGYMNEPITDGFALMPTGIWEPYVGLKLKLADGDTTNATGFSIMYPNVSGKLTKDSIVNTYNSDNVEEYIPITPRHYFKDFTSKNLIDIYGTRGDCYITGSMIDVKHGERTKFGGPQNARDTLKSVDTDEVNSYRAFKNSDFILGTHLTNYLSYGRYPKIIDTADSAELGKSPSFAPFRTSDKGYLDREREDKQQSTTGFNKGFKDHFIGQKFVGVSRNAPYIVNANENTVIFSNPTDSRSFINGYREFDTNNYKDIEQSSGGITKLLEWRGNLVSVHAHGIHLTGVNDQAMLNTEAGQSVRMGTVNVLAEKPHVISSEFGSRWLKSICMSDNFIYGVDVDRGVIWASDGRGLTLKSIEGVNKLLKVFLTQFQGREELPGKRYISSYFDSIKGEIIFTLYNSESNITEGLEYAKLDPRETTKFLSMTPEERQTWVSEGDTDEEKISRRTRVDTFEYFHTGADVKMLTLVYSESTKTWSTRLSYTPEFMFTIDSSSYSLNNKDDSFDYDLLNVDDHGILDSRQLIWEHGPMHTDIPLYGSFFGKSPLFAAEYAVNSEANLLKKLNEIEIVGNRAMPSEIHYLVSKDAPWLNRLVDPTGYDYTAWQEIVDEFNSKMLEESRSIVNPARWYIQEMHDRRTSPIFRANYIYESGSNKVKVARSIQSMYNFTTDPKGEAIPHKVTNMTDKYFHVKLVYNSGENVYIKEINSSYKQLS